MKILKKLGSGADVVSGGELLRVLKAGIAPNKIVFSGVGKSEEELKLAITKKILLINVESESEAILINKISKKLNLKTSIGIRLNPNVGADTHRKISTGKSDNKFGLLKNNLIQFCKNAKNFKNIKIEAFSVHIGSQILDDKPYKKTLGILRDIIDQSKIKIKYIDLGGGFGIPYRKKDKSNISLKSYARLVNNFKKKYNCKVIFEPGRFIVGNTGVLVTKVQYIKENKNKLFIVLDAGMNDFMRTALYEAHHEIVPIIKNNKKSRKKVEFVGPICETTDKFTLYSNYQKLSENDFVVLTNVGAYGSTLSSNYNLKPFASELIIDKKKVKIIKRRQSLLKLVAN